MFLYVRQLYGNWNININAVLHRGIKEMYLSFCNIGLYNKIKKTAQLIHASSFVLLSANLVLVATQFPPHTWYLARFTEICSFFISFGNLSAFFDCLCIKIRSSAELSFTVLDCCYSNIATLIGNLMFLFMTWRCIVSPPATCAWAAHIVSYDPSSSLHPPVTSHFPVSEFMNTVYAQVEWYQSKEKWTLKLCIQSLIYTVIFMLVLFTEIYK